MHQQAGCLCMPPPQRQGQRYPAIGIVGQRRLWCRRQQAVQRGAGAAGIGTGL